VESKLKPNTLQVERFYVTTIDKKTGVERTHDQLKTHRDEDFYVYTEAVLDTKNNMDISNLYMYSIVSKNANANTGVIILKQKPIYVVHSKYPDSEYQAKLLYIGTSSLSRKHGSHGEAVQLIKRYESIFGEHTFTKFETGELFERPLRLFNQPPACVSVHEPLARPPVLSVIVQDPVDPRVSVVVCKVTWTINSCFGALEMKGNPFQQSRYVVYVAIIVVE
jgi:hypothetical protein